MVYENLIELKSKLVHYKRWDTSIPIESTYCRTISIKTTWKHLHNNIFLIIVRWQEMIVTVRFSKIQTYFADFKPTICSSQTIVRIWNFTMACKYLQLTSLQNILLKSVYKYYAKWYGMTRFFVVQFTWCFIKYGIL